MCLNVNTVSNSCSGRCLVSKKKKRERCKNYTEREKYTLLEIVETFLHIIENKKTDNINIHKKKEAWDAVATKFNAIAETGVRTGAQLKLLYESMKKKVKKDKADDKVELYRTGGGNFSSKVDRVGMKLLEINNATVIELTNSYDSSAPFDSNNDGGDNNNNEIDLGQSTETNLVLTEYVVNTPASTQLVGHDRNCISDETSNTSGNSKGSRKRAHKQTRTHSLEKEEIKLNILKTRYEKENIEKDILLLKKKELELVIQEKQMKLEAMKDK